jgi:hypothetical protein
MGWKFDPAMSFAISCALIYNVVLATALTTGRVSVALVGAVLFGLSVACWRIANRLPSTTRHPLASPAISPWLIAPLATIVMFSALFVWRAFAFPLTGPDTPFRWNLLPQLMVALGRMDYYPPITDRDFTLYAFFDGFPPLVATQYWWTYSVLGSYAGGWTGFVTSAQFLSILWLTGCTVSRLTELSCGILAVAALAGSPLMLWAVVIGQESGFTALCVAGTAAAWVSARDDARWCALIPVALATQLGAVAREYGLVFIPIGLLIGASLNVPPRRLVQYAAVSLVITAPWYIHVWLKSGNPFFSLSLGGMFHVPSYVAEYWSACAKIRSPLKYSVAQVTTNVWQLFIYAPILWLGALVAAIAVFRRVLHLTACLVAIVAIWLTSIAYTAGGFIVTLRVLAPALVLSSLSLGIWLHHAHIPNGRSRHWIGLTVAGAVALVLGSQAAEDPWKLHGALFSRGSPPWSFTQTSIGPTAVPPAGYIVTDNPYLHAYLLLSGSSQRALPLWAPSLSFLFDHNLNPAEIHRRLQNMGVRIVTDPQLGVPTEAVARTAFFTAHLHELPTITVSPGTTGHLVPARP